MTHTVIAGVN